MHTLSTLALLALSTAVSGQASSLPVPFNAQIGNVRFPIRCNTLNESVVFNAVITATAPIYAETGQQLYYTDVTATLTIPQYIVRKAGGQAGYTADSRVRFNLNLVNASPSTLAAFPNGVWVNGTSVSGSGDSTLRVPKTGVLGDIGPVTAGSANVLHTISLGAINAELYLRNTNGAQVGGVITVSCPVQNPPVLIGVVNITPINGTAKGPLRLRNGRVPSFPSGTPNVAEYGCFKFSYFCPVPGIGNLPFLLTACGQVNAAVRPGAQFSLTRITSLLTAGEDALVTIRRFFPRATRVNTTISDFRILATNASPASLNVFAGGAFRTINPIPAPNTNNLTIAIPVSPNTLTAGPFTAGSTVGSRAFLSIGNASVTAQFLNDAGQSQGILPLTCTVRTNPLQLIGVLITNQNYPTYSSTRP